MQDFNIAIEEYNAICDRIAQIFANKYFGKDASHVWIDGGVTVITVDKYFFSMTDMLDYMTCKYSKKEMFERANYAIDCAYKNEVAYSIKNYRKLK